MRHFLALPLALLASSCLHAPLDRQAECKELEAWMSGSFSSEAQHREDDRFFHIVLHMQPIWTSRQDGPWLYVEQAAAAKAETPYRQRVYRLRQGEAGSVWSDVYTLPGDPLSFAGAWREPGRFDALDPAQLELRAGCSLLLVKQPDGAWQGSTEARNCASELSGAAWATSEARIEPQLLTSWDRGYAAEGKQVWGSKAGPYRFVKR
jgi:hypothetical protein